MPAGSLGSLAGYVAIAFAVGILAAGLAAATARALGLRARLARHGLAAFLLHQRRRVYLSRGLHPSRTRLRRQVRDEATRLLAAVSSWPSRDAGAKLPRWLGTREPLFDDAAAVEAAVTEVLPDVREGEERAAMLHSLRRIDVPLSSRYELWSGCLTFAWALVMSLHYLEVAQALVIAVFASVVARVVSRPGLALAEGPADRRRPPAAPPGDAPKPADESLIGRPGRAVRALNFAGGGFDTFMQLGVSHALVVIQGRPPDVVVGVSMGAVQAASLAEVLQAGEQRERELLGGREWSELGDEERKQVQHVRQQARAERLRHSVEAAQRAPEKLFDALLPDAHEIESNQPLAPYEHPQLTRRERCARDEAAAQRSGLVRLYNDLLRVPFSIGVLTRVVRRILGCRAAAEIRQRSVRWFIYFVETMRLWILLGFNLMRAARLVPIVLRAFSPPPETGTATVGALIFRFRTAERAQRWLRDAFWFSVLLIFWVGTSLLPLSVWGLVSRARGRPAAGLLELIVGPAVITVLVYLVPIALFCVIPRLFAGLRDFDRTTSRGAVEDLLKSIFVFGAVTSGWGVVVGLLAALLESLRRLLTAALSGRVLGWPEDAADWTASLLAWAGALWLIVVVAVCALVWNARVHRRPFIERLLAFYHLDDALLRVQELRNYLVALFDPGYYDRLDVEDAVEEALANSIPGPRRRPAPKPVGSYSAPERLEPIHLGLAVANTSTGKLDVVGPGVSVVDGLEAALAVTPLFPAVELDGSLYLDGANVANEPTRALVGLLRQRLNPESSVVHIYSVFPFPVSKPNLIGADQPDGSADRPGLDEREGGEGHPDRARGRLYLNLVEVAYRALRLRRFQDATVELGLVGRFSKAIPEGDLKIGDYFRAHVAPIETDRDIDLNRRIPWARKEERRQVIFEAIADGCRAALQVMIPHSVEQEKVRTHALPADDPEGAWVAPCGAAVRHHLGARDVGFSVTDVPLPGSDPETGPGLREICAHCRLWPGSGRQPAGETAGPSPAAKVPRASLRCGEWKASGPPWPHEREIGPEKLVGDPHFEPPEDVQEERRSAVERLKTLDWPSRRGEIPETRPTVSVLFSGGVFRGVYQVGVLTALSELEVVPDLIAGASVGSITAALAASAFTPGEGESAGAGPDEEGALLLRQRRRRIARLAAVYLVIDRVIMTDRFADFVRELTLRAADTRFSILQADRLFRRYDDPAFAEFERNARQVVGGLERLLYITPYQLNQLVRDFRDAHLEKVTLAVRTLAQQLLDRMQVGDEILGTEPLRELIDKYVIERLPCDHPVGRTFDDLRKQSGIQFLATTTNLTEGRLEVLDLPSPHLAASGCDALLAEGLLASSAFPGVFRPRWSWELRPATARLHQYIDGGVMDNLPLEAVSQFLVDAADAGLIPAEPNGGDTPHLMLAASLEVNARRYDLASTRRELKESWLALRRRAKELHYNTKLGSYEGAQRKLRELRQTLRDEGRLGDRRRGEPVDVEVVAIKPEWLCGTFAFHPMLGFRRAKQARSIAHGCAGTLLRFAQIKNDASGKKWLDQWVGNGSRVAEESTWADAFDRWRRDGRKAKEGQCWLQKGICPYSRVALEGLNRDASKADTRPEEKPLPGPLIDELARIHEECRRPETHLRRI